MFDCDKIKKDKKSRRYLYDFYLLAAIILPTLCWIFISAITKKSGDICTIQYTNDSGVSEYKVNIAKHYNEYLVLFFDAEDSRYRLSDFYDNSTSVYSDLKLTSYEGDYNVISFSEDGVQVIDANCNDHTCVNTRTAHNNGDTIICLPHKLTISIISDSKEGDYDAVTW